MTHPARLSLVILAVHELRRAARFYDAVFAWPVAVETPVYIEFALPAEMRLGLYLREGFARNTQREIGLRTAGHTTATELYVYVDDLGAMADALAEVGARCLSPIAPRPWGDTAAYYEDPEGNVVVIAHPTGATVD